VPEEGPTVAASIESASAGLLAVAFEGIEEGAVEAGLPQTTARAFVRQTALGTALLLDRHPGSPADLKDQVASPGGTTIAGLAVLEDRGVRGAFIRAVETAARRDSAPPSPVPSGSCRWRQESMTKTAGRISPSEGREK
jgi:pyrroline-5-carboxylate reductase